MPEHGFNFLSIVPFPHNGRKVNAQLPGGNRRTQQKSAQRVRERERGGREIPRPATSRGKALEAEKMRMKGGGGGIAGPLRIPTSPN